MITDWSDIQREEEVSRGRAYPGGPLKYLADKVAYQRSPEGRKEAGKQLVVVLVLLTIGGFAVFI